MGIDGEGWPSAAEKENTSRGLGPYPFKEAQPLLRLLYLHLADEIEREFPPPFGDGLQDIFNARGLDVG
jgi:hypothetical protein